MGGPGRAGASRREGDSVAACWGQCVPRPANPLVCASVCKDGHTPRLGDFNAEFVPGSSHRGDAGLSSSKMSRDPNVCS